MSARRPRPPEDVGIKDPTPVILRRYLIIRGSDVTMAVENANDLTIDFNGIGNPDRSRQRALMRSATAVFPVPADQLKQ